MAKRFQTRDGARVGVGDHVWTANHLPWVITWAGERFGGYVWVEMERDPGYPAQDDLDDENDIAEEDFSIYIYKSHPTDTSCDRAGCRYRPWGAL